MAWTTKSAGDAGFDHATSQQDLPHPRTQRPSRYAENSPDAQAHFASGALDTYEFVDQNTSKTKIDLAKFRVIGYGPVYDVQ